MVPLVQRPFSAESIVAEGPDIDLITSAGSKSGSWFFDEELNRLFGEGDEVTSIILDDISNYKNNPIENDVDVRSALRKKVIEDGNASLFIVVRRKAVLRRVLYLWQRATTKVNPHYVLRVKFMGEEGIDSGALAKEFMTSALEDIKKMFIPERSPINSTNDIHNGIFLSNHWPDCSCNYCTRRTRPLLFCSLWL
mgnify:CR=1 FL=1